MILSRAFSQPPRMSTTDLTNIGVLSRARRSGNRIDRAVQQLENFGSVMV